MRWRRVNEVVTLMSDGATGVWAVRISSGFHIDKTMPYLSLAWARNRVSFRVSSTRQGVERRREKGEMRVEYDGWNKADEVK